MRSRLLASAQVESAVLFMSNFLETVRLQDLLVICSCNILCIMHIQSYHIFGCQKTQLLKNSTFSERKVSELFFQSASAKNLSAVK